MDLLTGCGLQLMLAGGIDHTLAHCAARALSAGLTLFPLLGMLFLTQVNPPPFAFFMEDPAGFAGLTALGLFLELSRRKPFISSAFDSLCCVLEP